MNIQSIATSVALFVLTGSAFAQDKIFLSNGNIINAKVKAVSGNNVIYRVWGGDNNSEYTMAKAEVDKIKYENGVEERFNDNNANYRDEAPVRASNAMKLSKSILAFSPIAFTENGVGFAFSFEQGIDKSGIIAYSLPIIATFNLNNAQESANNKHQDGMVYFSPGIKFYPTSSYGRVKYAIGPSLVLGAGEKTTGGDTYVYVPYGSYQFVPYQTQSKFLLGIMVNNSLNINPTPHFYMGLEFGFGFTYINTLGGTNQGITGITQSGFKLGYRF